MNSFVQTYIIKFCKDTKSVFIANIIIGDIVDVNIKFCRQSMHYMNVNADDILSVYLFTGY